MAQHSSFTIRRAGLADAAILAGLMADEIHWGRLRDFGQGFLTLVHRHLIDSKYSFCTVAEQDGEIIGYAAGVADTPKFNRDFVVRRGFLAAVGLLPRILLRPRHVATILHGLTYFPRCPSDDPRAELVAIMVRPRALSQGVGRALFDALTEEFRARSVAAFKIGTVAVTNEAANSFYRRVGCELLRTVPFYRDTQVNVYRYDLADKQAATQTAG